MSFRRVLGAAGLKPKAAFVLRWCRPAHAGDVFVSFGVRRRRPFLREGPNRFVLRVEVRLLSSGRVRAGRRRRGGR
ncbi:hypothetical protein Taro_037732 [Colocasia esculenta]|uniref:Uncharacterized protein n=1 Tax=Colocasia esculenta TaxID=4460 RepID=A0A843WBV6_COLES|nr:hypothetical protein [Colocasia esculenta]